MNISEAIITMRLLTFLIYVLYNVEIVEGNKTG
jgi:hypothetical protein